jgi:hypothetical protein
LDPIETLKLMEKVTQETPDKMEQGFSAYSDCSNPGKKNTLILCDCFLTRTINEAIDDECVAASEIYKCSSDKVPGIVNDMVQLAKGGPDIVMQLIVPFKGI